MRSARVKIQPSGCVNGQPWPEVGGSVDHFGMSEASVEGMVGAGILEYVEDAPKVEKRPAPAKRTETRKA